MSTAPNAATSQTPATPPASAPAQGVTTPSADGVSVDELANAWKAKFPGAYDKVDNHELVSSVIQKYPVYQTHLSTGGLQEMLKYHNSFNTNEYLQTPEAKEIRKLSEGTAMGSGAGEGMESALKFAMDKGAGNVATKVVEHELTDNAGNPLVTNVERGVVGKAREYASNALSYAKANPKTALLATFLASKAGFEPAKILHLLHLTGE